MYVFVYAKSEGQTLNVSSLSQYSDLVGTKLI